MPYVVTDACIQCKYTDCVPVCQMDCFVEGPNFVVIDPEGCIDCSVCVGECPVGAIVNAHELPESQQHLVALNAELARHPAWRPLTQRHAPMPGHAAWAGVPGKLAQLRRE